MKVCPKLCIMGQRKQFFRIIILNLEFISWTFQIISKVKLSVQYDTDLIPVQQAKSGEAKYGHCLKEGHKLSKLPGQSVNQAKQVDPAQKTECTPSYTGRPCTVDRVYTRLNR